MLKLDIIYIDDREISRNKFTNKVVDKYNKLKVGSSW